MNDMSEDARNTNSPPDASRRRWVIVTAAVLCLCLAFSAYIWRSVSRLAHVPKQSSQLVCEQPEHDFGTVPSYQAGTLQWKFVLKNTGSRPIRIKQQHVTCGCTSSALPKDAVGPGESVTFPANVNWGGRDGHQLARLMLETDESPAGRVILSVKGNVNNPIAVWPQMFDFGELDPGASNEQLLHVSAPVRKSIESAGLKMR